MTKSKQLIEHLTALACSDNRQADVGLDVFSPHDGEKLVTLRKDTAQDVTQKIAKAVKAQKIWANVPRQKREELLEKYSATISQSREVLGFILQLEAGKTPKEALGEIDGSAAVLRKTIANASLPDLGDMQRCKERLPVGVVGLITSFNFPAAVAHWTMAPAVLAANSVIWKPSDKTPICAVAAKAVFDSVAGEYADLFQVIICGRDVAQTLVADENVSMISATGSVGMGQGINKTLATKTNNQAPSILELGGNNGVILSDKMSKEHLRWSLEAIVTSFLGTTGQRCTNTRRLIVHTSIIDDAKQILEEILQAFLKEYVGEENIDEQNPYGYAALIDESSFKWFEHAKEQAAKQGGEVLMGKRLFADLRPGAYAIEPAIAMMPKQSEIMHEETFAPIIFMAPYEKDIDEAIGLLNAPENAGLVAGLYTQNQKEVDAFCSKAEAGHVLVNSPKGTGTPAHDMGFGGNKHSGEGEILNSADPLQAFTRSNHFRRIASNKTIVMDK